MFLAKVNKKKHCLSFGVVFRCQRHGGPYPTCCVSVGGLEQSSKFHDSSAPRFVSWDVLVL